jgi:hypothetical protein
MHFKMFTGPKKRVCKKTVHMFEKIYSQVLKSVPLCEKILHVFRKTIHMLEKSIHV